MLWGRKATLLGVASGEASVVRVEVLPLLEERVQQDGHEEVQAYHHGDDPPGDKVQLGPRSVGPPKCLKEHHPVVDHHEVPQGHEGGGKVVEIVCKVGQVLIRAAPQGCIRPGSEPGLRVEEQLHAEEGKEVVDDDQDPDEPSQVLEQVQEHGGDLGEGRHVGDNGEGTEDDEDREDAHHDAEGVGADQAEPGPEGRAVEEEDEELHDKDGDTQNPAVEVRPAPEVLL